ncbi:hypothetical protein BV25DRAFT_407755 [Artomyces pyxidatus]|uniref:Uncharacterized protein n=1 Tax=Artomyces pyxidatus TaxID=48021 RepID=A0ACB8SE94_9AGAM|nr:hypothetical protein BV25DRAFT_407755 [Artomyces pyxidatus]
MHSDYLRKRSSPRTPRARESVHPRPSASIRSCCITAAAAASNLATLASASHFYRDLTSVFRCRRPREVRVFVGRERCANP